MLHFCVSEFWIRELEYLFRSGDLDKDVHNNMDVTWIGHIKSRFATYEFADT